VCVCVCVCMCVCVCVRACVRVWCVDRGSAYGSLPSHLLFVKGASVVHVAYGCCSRVPHRQLQDGQCFLSISDRECADT
jgi:hypothetical protein